jgi:integrase
VIKRRGPRGQGSIFRPRYKIKDGSYRPIRNYWIRYTDELGKRRSEPSGYATKDGARSLLTERVAKINKGEFAEYEQFKDYTLKKVTDGLRTHYKEMGRRSVRKVQRNLDHIDKFFGPTYRADALTAEQIAHYREARLKEVSLWTLAHELRSLKTALRLALSQGKIRRMPVIQIPNDPNRKDEGEFTREQFDTLLTELPEYLKPLVRFLWFTGMRIMEPVELTWSEVNTQHGELRISGRRTKNGKQKALYLDGQPLDILRQQPKKFEHVFTDGNGDKLRYDSILEAFQQACKRAKIAEGFTGPDGTARTPGFHDLRRSFARVANRKGIPHRTIMEIAGWKCESMLLRYLGDVKPSEQRDAFKRLR